MAAMEDMKVIVDETLNILLAGRDSVCLVFTIFLHRNTCPYPDCVSPDVCHLLSGDISPCSVST